MPLAVTLGATCACSFGTTPAVFTPQLPPRALFANLPVGSVSDNNPEVNFTPPCVSCFGMCTSLANPEVQSATAMAQGVLTPMACQPEFPAPWTPGALKTKVGDAQTLTQNSTLMCTFGGVITILNPGQTTVMVD